MVRTLVADVDEDGRVLSGYLVEFVSEDAQESQFKEYVGQWLAGDFGNKSMLVAEYTIGYASTSAMFYAPDKPPKPVTMRLEERLGAGKTAAEIWYCYVTVWYEDEVCAHVENNGGVCTRERHTETTCVCIAGCYDDSDGGDDGDGCPSGGCDTGGGDSGDDDDEDSDDDDDEDETEDITFDFSCKKSVARGETAGCTVKVTYAEGVEEKQHTFNWSSATATIDTTLSTQDASGSEWRGVATEDATITLIIGEEKYSADISVNLRTVFSGFSIPALNVTELQYEALPVLGRYSIDRELTAPFGSPIAGTGPWSGTYITGDLDTGVSFSGVLRVSDDFHPETDKQPTYAAPHKIDSTDCANPEQLDTDPQSYYSVNLNCDTVAGFEEMESLIIRHEYDHQTSANECLAETTIFETMEGLVTSSSAEVEGQIKGLWSGEDEDGQEDL